MRDRQTNDRRPMPSGERTASAGSDVAASLPVAPVSDSPLPHAQSSDSSLAQSSAEARDRLLPDTTAARRIEEAEPRNMALLSAHLIVHRMAWIFKTESVLVPAFVDAFAGAGWVRGCLPFINRMGQSLPVLFFAHRVERSRSKKRMLAATTMATGLVFLAWGLLWRGLERDSRRFWLTLLVPPLYFVFAAAYGMYQLVLAVIQGELIRADRRGRLLGISGGIGAALAIVLAWIFLERWLALPSGGWERVYGFAGVGFLVSGLVCLWIDEPPRAIEQPLAEKHENAVVTAIAFFRHDASFRSLVWVTLLFMTSQLLFPHYQALGLAQPGAVATDMMGWVIAQNAALGVFSLIGGAIADRHGTRRSLSFLIAVAAITPVAALALSRIPGGARFYWIAYALLGSVPVTLRVLFNYVLEAVDSSRHARAISGLQVCMAAPYVLAPFVGYAVDRTGFGPPFLAVAALVFSGALLTARLPEPRLTGPDRPVP